MSRSSSELMSVTSIEGHADRLQEEWVNPLVCDCQVPDVDPKRDFGMCQSCKRKPLALLARR